MPPPRRKRRATRPELPPSGLLDWSVGHWTGVDRPCRYCGKDTRLKDSQGHPSHKVCAEKAIAQQIAEASAAYENERLPNASH